MVAGFRGADEIVVRGIQQLGHRLELAGVAVGKLLGGNTLRARRLLHLLAVLVGACQKEDITAIKTLEARHGVRRDQLVGMADMRLAVRVGNRGGNVEGCLVCHGGHCVRLTLSKYQPLLAHVMKKRNTKFRKRL